MKNSEYVEFEREFKSQRNDKRQNFFYTACIFAFAGVFFYFACAYQCPKLQDVPLVLISGFLFLIAEFLIIIGGYISAAQYDAKIEKLDELWKEKIDKEDATKRLGMLPEEQKITVIHHCGRNKLFTKIGTVYRTLFVLFNFFYSPNPLGNREDSPSSILGEG